MSVPFRFVSNCPKISIVDIIEDQDRCHAALEEEQRREQKKRKYAKKKAYKSYAKEKENNT